jgi:hypothetical protein
MDMPLCSRKAAASWHADGASRTNDRDEPPKGVGAHTASAFLCWHGACLHI